MRAGGNRTRPTVVLLTLGPIARQLFWANALVFGSVAVYALALCIEFSVALVTFFSLASAAESWRLRGQAGRAETGQRPAAYPDSMPPAAGSSLTTRTT